MKNRYLKSVLAFLLSLLLLFSMPASSLAHSGRTDSSGGHHDYQNASGLGSYHYHHGMGPHLHPNGVCPYSIKATYKASNSVATFKAAQQELKDLGYYTGDVDGSFGPKSKAALKEFQGDNGLVVDGKLGPKSKAALGIE